MEKFMETNIKKELSLLTRIRNRWNGMLKKRSGQSTTEYILILAIVVMIASRLKVQLQNTMNGGMQKVNQQIMTDIDSVGTP